ncbi:chitinase [Pseudomonas syringae pv. lapsa]|uniref:Glycoside hydrolase family 18 protein n=1 Tax=Pseudomonas syringae pv. lapsa TaxID=199201 RepID=A0AB74A5L2_PSESX|nr:fibronectin type III domain-containing protein [Pseudomonas syringae]ALU62709.1 chitinase [Pseudomonas syringae pv. lapsa]KPX60647.1 Glycoside hydrolase family 18 protein [Pseudomonas syringae pv. lapsa]RML20225.1 Glycoside hydrolase family 18 protein [Pseudomonas syringae pv. lapsa]RML25860.1 Glycoside hydrolase family 18 protein [Pseudomonas syringae pv. lapsa]
MLNPKIINQYKNKKVDAASTMTDISGKNILMGFWHNWPSESGQGYQQGMFEEMALTGIHEAYNVVAVAFMKGSGIPTFKPYNLSDEAFRAEVAALNAQGRAVLISLGGADAHIELHAGQEEALAYEIIRLVEVYGFDGLDIDLEQTAITFADNRTVLPAALRMVREHYNTEGKHFIISMAPEFPYLRASKKLPVLKEITTYFPFLKDFVTFLESLTSGGAYLAYINALEDIYDFIAPQYYNQGGDGIWVDEANNSTGQYLRQDDDTVKKDFLYYLTDSLIHGTRGFSKIPANRLAIGLPTNNDAAATGYVINPDDVKYALDKLQDDGNPIRGLMTWSVNWDNGISKDDHAYNWEFAKRYSYLTGGETPVPGKPTVPADLRSIEQTPTSVKLVWSLSVGVPPVLRYELCRNSDNSDNSVSLFADSPSYDDIGLQPGTTYSYQVRAINIMGNTSAFSAAISVSTQAESGGGQKPTTPVLSLSGVTDKSVSLKWTLSSSDIENGNGIDKYQIGRDGWPIAAVLADQPPEYTDTGLTAGKKYTYFVVAKDTQSQWSEVSNLLEVSTDPAPEKPSVPVDFRSTARTTTSLTLDWSVSANANGPYHYELFRNDISIGTDKVPPFVDEGLWQSRLYSYRIIATDGLGNSSERSEELLATTDAQPSVDRPRPPQNLRHTGSTATSISLAWDEPASHGGLASYQIHTFNAPTVYVDSTVLAYTVEGLSPGKNYQHLVGARDVNAELSGPSSVVQTSTQAALPAWKTDTDYAKGDKVMHAGASYICLNPHHSQIDWYPGSAPTLWAPWTEQAGGRGFRDWPKEWQ